MIAENCCIFLFLDGHDLMFMITYFYMTINPLLRRGRGYSILINYWIGCLSSEMLRNAANYFDWIPEIYNITYINY